MPRQMSLTTETQCAGTIISTDYKEPQCIALDGDQMKPRENPASGGNGLGVNEDGAGYTGSGFNNCAVQAFENHAQDSRIKPIEVSDTRNQKDGTGGNNLPLVVHKQTPFVKTSHASGKNGLGEKWEQCEVAGTRNAIEGGDGRNQECIVYSAVAQNTRDEVRVVNGDGQIAGALAAQPGMK